MATTERGPFARKPIEALLADTKKSDSSLKREIGAFDLTALGLGAIIGASIFVIIGEAIGVSGPAVILSFSLAGLTCVFSALAFAELASMIPVSGSAYTYSYATMGELVAWIIGWDLLLEYSVTVAAVAVGWGGYFNTFLDLVFGVTLPAAVSAPREEGGIVNVPAMFIVLAVTGVLLAGVRQSARINTVMVIFKVVVFALFIVLGATALQSANYTPFFSQGYEGVFTAASLIFFAYIGFDVVSTSSEEVKGPERTLPIAIIGSLVIATVIYILVAVVTTGLLPQQELAGEEAPLGKALSEGVGIPFAGIVIAVGALVAITSVVLTWFYGSTRLVFAMCRDGLLPAPLAKVSESRRVPYRVILIFAVVLSLLAAFLPLSELAKLVNVGTLFAFILVNIGVIILRRTQPDARRGYRVPFVPVFPLIGVALCVGLLFFLSGSTMVRFAAWLAIGLVIYFVYGRRHSRLQHGEVSRSEADAG